MGLVLDTSILIGAERGRFDLVAFLEKEAAAVPVFLTAMTASELLHGVHRAEGARRLRRENFVEDLLADMVILPFDLSAAREHARLWADLESRGNLVGPHDLIIAAICVSQGHKIATLNIGEFNRIPGLNLADVAPYVSRGS
ncbi:MAG: PIN domain-containing protein [Verrucomicrobiae bacterium]|nr:PIN domain-containing protein [Verrucomicrobiae bacterium]MCB1092965.1 PIN domain-containing protein [Verrucomicrobiae bacterium]